MIINHNIQALNTYNQFSEIQQQQSNAVERLSSGLRINRAGDDAAGLAISEKMRAQVRGLDQASRNVQDGISLIQTAEGALEETHSILQRMRELATQAANDTYVATDREEIQKEINQLTREINRIGETTQFNTEKLLDGSKGIVEGPVIHGFSGGTTNGSSFIPATSASTTVGGLTLTAGGNLVGSSGNNMGIDFLIGTSNTATYLTGGNNLLIRLNVVSLSSVSRTDIEDALSSIINISNILGSPWQASDIQISGNGPFDLSGTNASTRLTGGRNAIAAGQATPAYGFVEMKQLQNGDQLTIGTQNFGFYESDLFTSQSEARTKLNFSTSTRMIDVFNQTDIQIATKVRNQLTSTNSVKLAADDNRTSSIISLEAKQAGVAGNDIPISFKQKNKSGIQLQVGANSGQNFTVFIGNMRANSLGVEKNTLESGWVAYEVGKYALDVSNHLIASHAINIINESILTVSAQRSQLGAYQNRLEHTINNLGAASENLTAAESRVRDVDMAKEIMEQTKQSILSQVSQAMLAQANQNPQNVLQLLR